MSQDLSFGNEQAAGPALEEARPAHTSEPSRVASAAPAWAPWQTLLFRFFFLYLLLTVSPWTWLARIPGLGFISRAHVAVERLAVEAANARLFHVRETLVPLNGSGDTSYAWARLWLFLSLAAAGTLLWTSVRRLTSHERLLYWLRTTLRFYLAIFCLSYGIIKLFALQMPFPTPSLLATPLGDLLPMRLSWMFLGYSAPYQVFSGVMETTAGLLLLHRRTVTLGLFMATGAFMNVVMINLGYDVPVKIFSAHLLLACLVLLALDARRLLDLFVLNRPVAATKAWEPYFDGPRRRWAMRAAKLAFVWFFLVVPLRSGWSRYQAVQAGPTPGPFEPGVYEVVRYRRGEGTALGATDPLAWKDVIFDSGTAGSVGTADTLFWQRYGRGHFRYRADAEAGTMAVWRTSAAPGDSTWLFDMRYGIPEPGRILLWSVIRGDSLEVELARTERHFQLAERQFHWLSEYNR